MRQRTAERETISRFEMISALKKCPRARAEQIVHAQCDTRTYKPWVPACERRCPRNIYPHEPHEKQKKELSYLPSFQSALVADMLRKITSTVPQKVLTTAVPKNSHRPMRCTTPLAARRGRRATKKASLATARIAAQHVRSDTRGKRSDSLTSCPATSRTPATVSEQAA